MIKPTNVSTNLKSEMILEALSLGGIEGFLAAELPSIRARVLEWLDDWGYYSSKPLGEVLDIAGAAAIRQLATSDDIREALRCLAARQVCKETTFIANLPLLLREAHEKYGAGSRDALGVILNRAIAEWISEND